MPAAQSDCSWTKYIPWVSTALLGSYVVYKIVKNGCCSDSSPSCSDDQMVNKTIQKDEPKVVTVVDIEDLGEKTAYCRCWRSKKFPYCDGSHNEHNRCTGDNVGPLCIKKEAK